MKKIIFLLGLLILAGNVFAYNVNYKEMYAESKTVFVDYDNDYRHSTYDYRHGYSYRATRDYFEKRYGYVSLNNELSLKEGYNYYVNYRDSDYDYEYRVWSYEDRDDWGIWSYEDRDDWGRVSFDGSSKCYYNAPRDKLFYIKC